MDEWIRNSTRAKQLVKFDGFKLNHRNLENVGATDIDALVDIRDKLLIIFEVKFNGVEVPKGQKYTLQRLVEDAKKAGKHAIAIVLEHDVCNPEETIYLANLIAREVYESEELKWKPMKRSMTATELANWYVDKYFDK